MYACALENSNLLSHQLVKKKLRGSCISNNNHQVVSLAISQKEKLK
jgi:hypothetical protein